jgi:hypothetical protein
MQVIRAHFDGRVIVPDEPISLEPHSEVIVLVNRDAAHVDAALGEATRLYYEEQSAEEQAEDEAWGNAVARDSRRTWE